MLYSGHDKTIAITSSQYMQLPLLSLLQDGACQLQMKKRLMWSCSSLWNYWLLTYTKKRGVTVFRCDSGEPPILQRIVPYSWSYGWPLLNSVYHKTKKMSVVNRFIVKMTIDREKEEIRKDRDE